MEGKISFIEIEKFRSFDNLRVSGFKRVNLIGGKNNIGKTSLLEAISLCVSAVDLSSLLITIKNIMGQRYNIVVIDIFKQGENSINIKADKNKISLKYKNKIPEAILSLAVNEIEKSIPVSNIFNMGVAINQQNNSKVNFISSRYTDIIYLSKLYSALISLGKEEYIDKSLRLFDENILYIRLVMQDNGPAFKVKMKNMNTLIPLSSLGEGVNRYMALTCAIWASSDGYLLIDEIENGIHYTIHKKLWETVFECSKEANCQVFVTTHSKECIKAFNATNKKNDGVYIELYKNKKTNQIVSKTRDNEVLDYSLNHNGQFRGE